MQLRFFAKLGLVLFCLFAFSWAWAGESKAPAKIKAVFKTHTVYNSLHLTAGDDAPAFYSYDLSPHEGTLAGRGARVTPTSYSQLFKGDNDAFTTRELLELSAELGNKFSAGATLEGWGQGGSDALAVNWSTQIPLRYRTAVDNSAFQLYNAWLKSDREALKFKLEVGQYFPRYYNKPQNQIKLGNWAFRPPGNPSYFAHVGPDVFPCDLNSEFRKFYLPSRDPFFGVNLEGEGKNFDFNFLTTRWDTTSQSVTQTRIASGGRIGGSFFNQKWGLGVFAFHINEESPAVAYEDLLGFDTSIKLSEKLTLFSAYTDSKYNVNSKDYSGKAYLVGFKTPVFQPKDEFYLHYQDVDKFYEAMKIHKLEHYPENFKGWWAEYKYPIKGGSLKAQYIALEQKDPQYEGGNMTVSTNPSSTPLIDHYFPIGPNPGKLKVWGLYADHQFHPRLTLVGDYEFFNHQKDATNFQINKDISTFHLAGIYKLSKKLSLYGGFRSTTLSGQWDNISDGFGTYSWADNNLRFDIAQTIPKIGIYYLLSPDSKVSLLYNGIKYSDKFAQSLGKNADWDGNQFIMQASLKF